MRQRRIRIAVTGECMVELLPVRSEGGEALFRQGFSGDTLNTAVYLSRLGGLETSYLSAVGNDPLSESMLDFWQGEGVDCSLVRRIPGASPGLYMIRNDRHGERSFFYWRSSCFRTRRGNPSGTGKGRPPSPVKGRLFSAWPGKHR